MEEDVINEFYGILPQLGDMVWIHVLQIRHYIKKWRCLLWNIAYTPILRGSPPFAKSTILMKNHEDVLTVRRIIYMYFSIIDYFEVIKFIFIGDIELNFFIEFV